MDQTVITNVHVYSMYVIIGKGDLNVPLLNGFENGVNSGPESDEDMKYNSKNQKDATSGRIYQF